MNSSISKLAAKVVKSKDGTEIYAEACGDASKQAIVCIHGLGCAGTIFDSLFAPEILQKNLFLVRFDLRAHGRSGKPTTQEAYKSARYGEDFDAVCQAFEITFPPIFLGWSVGGTVSSDVFAYSQIKPKAVIYISATHYKGPANWLTPLCIEAIGAYLNQDMPANQAFKIISKFCGGFIAPSRAPSVPYADLTSWIGAATQLPPSSAIYSETRGEEPAALREAAKKGLPLCFIQGKDDQLVMGDPLLKHLKADFTNMEVHMLDNVGHLPFYEEPTAVADIILAFVARLTSSR